MVVSWLLVEIKVQLTDRFITNTCINALQAKVSEQVREAIPSKLCEALPRIVNERVNPKLAEVPQWIALKQIASLAGGIIGGNNKVPEYASFFASKHSWMQNKRTNAFLQYYLLFPYKL